MDHNNLNDLARRIREDLERRVLLGDDTEPTQTAATPAPQTSDPWKDLEAIWSIMRKPIPQAVWFIDEPDWHWRLRRACDETHLPFDGIQLDKANRRYIPSLGLPIHKWTTEEIAGRVEDLKAEGWSEDRIKRLYPFRERGIWVQVSNGQHYQVALTRNKLEAWLMNGILSRIERL